MYCYIGRVVVVIVMGTGKRTADFALQGTKSAVGGYRREYFGTVLALILVGFFI